MNQDKNRKHIWSAFWRKMSKDNQEKQQKDNQEKQQKECAKEIEMYPFTQWVTFGRHLYRHDGEQIDVEFVDKETGKRKTVIDEEGRIVRFPGIVKEEEWMHALRSEKSLEPIVRFRTSFERYDSENYIMLWQVQPDGRYWADEDGFGMTSDSEICLYTFLNQKGDFCGPFRIYSVGTVRYLQKPQKNKV